MRKATVRLRYVLYLREYLKVHVDSIQDDMCEIRTIRSYFVENSYTTSNRLELVAFIQNLRQKEKVLLFGVQCV